jgi:glycosyltransferase involved in cell wall biosynthesis
LAMVRAEDVHLVAPSHWVADMAKRSSLMRNYGVTVIPYGIETDVFQPTSKGLIKEALGIPPDRFVVCFAATDIDNRRKGLNFLLEALSQIRNKIDLLLLTVGAGHLPRFPDIPVTALGPIDNDFLLSRILNAADVFVMPSIEEQFGQIGVEALACGVPVVGFATGGVVDFVNQGKTGLLAPVGDSSALAQCILQLGQDRTLRERLGAQGRESVERYYSLETQAKNHLELYKRLMPRK